MKRKATPQSSDVVKTVKSKGHARNPIRELDLSWVESVCVDASSVRRRAATHGKRRSVKKDWQAAWLLHAVKCIDLTTLAGDDTARKVKRLCGKAKNPVSGVVLKGLELEGFDIKTGAVCVYPAMVKHAVAALEGSNSKIRASFVCHPLCNAANTTLRMAASSPRRPVIAAPTLLPPVLVSHTNCHASLAPHSRWPPRAASSASTPSYTTHVLLLAKTRGPTCSACTLHSRPL